MTDHHDPPDAEERIRRAALDLFARKGLAATSVREICEAAGVTKPTLYYHFGSKEGICRAVFQRAVDHFTARVDAALAMDCPPQQRLVEVVWVFLEIKRNDPNLVRVITALVFGAEEELPGLALRDLVQGIGASFGRAAQYACASGLTQPGSELRVQRGLRGVISAWVLTPRYIDEPPMERALAEQMVADLVWGLGRR